MIFSLDRSKTVTAGAVASEIALDMTSRRHFRLATTPAAGIWFRITTPGGTAATVAGDDCHYLAPGATVLIAAISTRTRVSVIREASTDAVVCLSDVPHVDS